MSARTPIQVMVTARPIYGLPLAVCGRSMFEHLGDDETLVLTVVHDRLPTDVQDRLKASWDLSRAEVRFVPFQPDAVRLPFVADVSPVYFTRFHTEPYLPAGCERVIFLDADTLVLTNLGRLWRHEMGGKVALATRDPFVPVLSHPDGPPGWRQLGLDANAPYLNGGVMLVDLAAWERHDLSSRAWEYLEQFGDLLRFGEQDAFNAVLCGRWGVLDARWQVQPRSLARKSLSRGQDAAERQRLLDDPWVYHFGGRLKPWDYRAHTPADAAFFACLDRTEWRGFRPPRSFKSMFFALYDSPVRDWLHPLEIGWSRVVRSARALRRRRASV